MPTKVFLSLGSNINAELNITAAIESLRKSFGSVECSPVYESEAVGFEGDNFLNLVVSIETSMVLDELVVNLKTMEDELGRVRNGPKFGPRVIDMDIILYGDFVGDSGKVKLPRYEIYQNAYVLLPLQDLEPQGINPESGETFSAAWESASEKMKAQHLWRSDFQI